LFLRINFRDKTLARFYYDKGRGSYVDLFV